MTATSLPTLLMTRDGDACERLCSTLSKYAAPQINCLTFSPLYTYNFDISPLSSTIFDKIIVTSERALGWMKSNADKLSGAQVLCVGPHLEKEITACGYFCAQTYPHIEFLLEDQAMYAGEAILYVRGLDIRHDVREIVAPQAKMYDEVIVYEARAHEKLPQDIQRAFETGHIMYLTAFSARAGEALVRLIRTHGLEEACTRIQCLCLSSTVLKSLGSLNWQNCHVASTPDMVGMAKLAADLLNNA